MIKAHSLIYAIYICLIVSLLCGGLLFYFSLYERLNLHYNLKEDLYLESLSAINYTLLNEEKQNILKNQHKNLESLIETKNYGALSLVKIKTFFEKDTVSSSYFAGSINNNDVCLYLCDFSDPLSYFGEVSLVGNQILPQKKTTTLHIKNKKNSLLQHGIISVSEKKLPPVNNIVEDFIEQKKNITSDFSDLISLKDSLYINSFNNTTQTIGISANSLKHKSIKGNYIFISKDTINIDKSCFLEDVILIAPTINIGDDFRGSFQGFASETIEIGMNVTLNYPSLLCVKNTSSEINSSIIINKNFRLYGAILLYGAAPDKMFENTITIEKNSLIIGDIYCLGDLMLKADIYGTVYTNRFFYNTQDTKHTNCISDIEINIDKKPKYFVSIPVLNSKNSTRNEIIKKLL